MSLIGSNFIYGNSDIEELHLPSSIDNVSACLDPSFLAGSSVSAVHFAGLDDAYMRANKDLFSTFGTNNASMVFYSSSGTKYNLNSNGVGLKTDLVVVVSIAIQYSGLNYI